MSGELRAQAHAKINLALVVGPPRPDGKHEVVTLLQQLELADEIAVRRAVRTAVTGFAGDTIVAAALEEVRCRTGVAFAATIKKQIPVAAGLGGGSTDAATALRLANRLLDDPLSAVVLAEIGIALGSDVPFFLHDGPMLGTGDGSVLSPITLPRGYAVLLVLPDDAAKESTAAVYRAFDDRRGAAGFEGRRAHLGRVLRVLERSEQFVELPANDLASSPVADELRAHGALRADVTGAGPVVYGLFDSLSRAADVAGLFEGRGRTWVTEPRW